MNKSPIKSRFDKVIEEIAKTRKDVDVDKIKRAFDIAMLWYGNDKRATDISRLHAVEVTELIGRLKMDTNSFVAGLLHHALQDELVDKEQIVEKFGKDVISLVDGVTKLSLLNFQSKKEQQIKSFRKMFLAMASDFRVILIKLADRLDLLKCMQHLYPDKQDQLNIAEETLDIYAPIASRLGIQWLKNDLEDLAFRAYKPEEYKKVEEFANQSSLEKQSYLDNIVAQLKKLMLDNGIDATVYGRAKHTYSIWRKLERKTLELDQLYDLTAFRVIVDNLEQCYKALGVVHATWRPIQGMFEDYIAMPKPNGYQSLHTNVLGPYGDRLEVQIRTRQMHDIAENGIAAHWRYKETGKNLPGKDSKEDQQVLFLRQLVDMQHLSNEGEKSEVLLESLKLDMFSDYVFVFTPTGDVMELPIGSTPVDFAFAVHSQVGMNITGAKVNGRIVPIKHLLKNGDTVEVITSKTQKPKREWLEFVKTNRARNKIRHAIREEEREASRKLGREMCERSFKDNGLSLNKYLKSGSLDKAAQDLKAKEFSDLMISVGRGWVSVDDILKNRHVAPELFEKKQKEHEVDEIEETAFTEAPVNKRSGKTGISVGGMDDMLVRFGKCCNPLMGEPIVGFVTRGHGVTIHKANCKNMPRNDKSRILEAYWDEESENFRQIAIKVISYNRKAMIKDLTTVFEAHNVNILSVSATTKEGIGTSMFKLQVKNLDQYDRIRSNLMRIEGVIKVVRVSG